MTIDLEPQLYNQRRLLDRYLRDVDDAAAAGGIVARHEAGPLPMSHAQERLWFADELHRGKPVYNELAAVRFKGRLNRTVFHACISTIVERHHILRTVFVNADGHLRQLVGPSRVYVSHADIRSVAPSARESACQGILRQLFEAPFDLDEGPLLRPVLVQTTEDEHVFVVAAHHIVFDLWSARVFLRELSSLYAALSSGHASPLSELPIQYADYSQWERERSETGEFRSGLETLGRQLASLPLLKLPARHQQQPLAAGRTRWRELVLSAQVRDGLRELAAAERTSLSNVLLAAYQALLYRYTGQEDFGIGLPVANRGRSECRDLIGLFVNTVVLRADLRGCPSFRELIARTVEKTESAHLWQEVPYERLLQHLQPKHRDGSTGLFRVVWAFQNVPDAGWTGACLEVQKGPALDSAFTLFDVEARAWDGPDGIHLHWIGNADNLETTLIDQMAEQFETLLTHVATGGADHRLADLALLSEADLRQLAAWNHTARTWPYPPLVHDGIAATAERRPDAVAVAYGESHLSYAALDRYANQLAQYLRGLGVTPGVRVGLYLERGPEMIIALLGVLKADGAYVPLDPVSPATRTESMIEDAQVAVLVTTENLAKRLSSKCPQEVYLDRDWASIVKQPDSESPSVSVPDSVAYVMFTSGSTGRPKGVMVTHRGVRNLAASQIEAFRIDETSTVLQFASIVFDAFTSEWTTALLAGAKLVLAPADELRPGREMLELFVRHNVDVVTLPPSMLATLPYEPLPALRTLVVAGEASTQDLVRQWCTGRVLLNAYGPTEITVCATVTGPLTGETPVTIGRPIANTQVHVLDAEGSRVPIGVPGELCVGGAGLANGYVNGAVTAARFVPDPFGASGGRLYRTGDRVRRRWDGELEFLGRIDRQVKWRGYRIEPQEIEAALVSHPAVQQSAVVLREDTPGDPRLVAYILPAAGPHADDDQLRQHLRKRLPEYMMPSAFVTVESWPRTPGGKIDRAALPCPERRDALVAADEQPRTAVEEIVASIWGDILGCTGIGRDSDFFALGGHSLLATQAITRLRAALDVELPLRVVFDTPTVAGVAAAVEMARSGRQAVATPPIVPVERRTDLPLSFAQQRLWFLDQLEGENALYNCHAAVRLTGKLEVSALRASLTRVVERHEILRTSFPAEGGAPVQKIALAAMPIPLVDLTGIPLAARRNCAQRLAQEEASRPFDLARGPLLRARLLCVDEDEHLLLLTLHHIVCDGWSLEIFVREISIFYNAGLGDGVPRLPELRVQYTDFATWQREWLSDVVLEDHVRYWRAQLSNAPTLAMPTDRARPATMSGRGARIVWNPRPSLAARLAEVSRQEGVTPFMTLLAAYQALLGRYAGQKDVIVGTDVAGRTRGEVEHLIGFFVNQLVLRTSLRGNPSFRELLARVRETTLDAYAHQDLPFEKLVDVLSPSRDTSRSPLFQVALVWQNAAHAELRLQGLAAEVLERGQIAAKHDLTLAIYSGPAGILNGELEYATDLFDRETIERLLHHFDCLLGSVLEDLDRPIQAANFLTPEQRAEVLSCGNPAPFPKGQSHRLEALIREQARRIPDAIALSCEGEHVSYREMNRRANQLARYLVANGTHPEIRVGIALGRNPGYAVALLGVFKAGGVAVPLDVDSPAPRLAQIIRDADVRILIGSEAIEHAGVHLVVRMESGGPVSREDGSDFPTRVLGDALAYLIYTSGSTGAPKGVGISYDAVDAYIQGIVPAVGLSSTDRVLQLAACSFDVSLEEILLTLACGGEVVFAPEAWFTRGLTAPALIARYRITVVELSTIHWQQWAAEVESAPPPDSLRFVLVGGQRIAPLSVRAWQRQPVPLLHVYGLTETAITSTVHPLLAGSAAIDVRREFPIGRPLAHASVYVLDEEGEISDIGVPGELCVGGPGVARGYVNQPTLTAARFVPDPWSSRSGERIYRTSDRARWRADGTLEFMGRLDTQLKVRGYRIEPGEIEQVLSQHEAVSEATVIPCPEPSGESSLAAFLIPAPGYRAGRDGQSIERRGLELWPSHGEYPIYDDLLYRAMADDDLRNQAYREALSRVAAGKRVVDVGTGGEAVLARLAIEAGAKKVYAIEVLEEAYSKAAGRIRDLGLSDRITLLRGDAISIELPEQVDVCLSELIGTIGSAEGAITILGRARKWLKPGGIMVPRRCITRMAAVELPREVVDTPAFEPLAAEYAQRIFESVGHIFDLRVCMRNLPRQQILSTSGSFEALDFGTAEITTDVPLDSRLAITRHGRLDGLLLWIELEVGDTGTVSALDHDCAWLPLFLPAFDTETYVNPGDSIQAACSSTVAGDGVHRDYFVSGVLRRSDGSEREFAHASYHERYAGESSGFHRRLLGGGAIQVRNSEPDRITTASLRTYLSGRLPAYMVPSAYTVLNSAPITPNGKSDRRALAAMRPLDRESGDAGKPRNPIEESIAGIWRELLGHPTGIHENFFEAGGHSLLATQLVSRISSWLGVDIPLRSVFDGPTIAQLACQAVRAAAETQDEETTLDLLLELERMPEADALALLAAEDEQSDCSPASTSASGEMDARLLLRR